MIDEVRPPEVYEYIPPPPAVFSVVWINGKSYFQLEPCCEQLKAAMKSRHIGVISYEGSSKIYSDIELDNSENGRVEMLVEIDETAEKSYTYKVESRGLQGLRLFGCPFCFAKIRIVSGMSKT